jgi:hypothetical protein
MSKNTYTVITFHFGSTYWVTKCLNNINTYSDDRLSEVIIINQDRVDVPELLQLPRVREVISFPENESQVAVLGHDHPSSIDEAIKSIKFETTHVIILDSDCFPISRTWLDELPDAAAAADPEKTGLTHPCFMVLPVPYLRYLSFSEGVAELGIDTGRLVGVQLSKEGLDFSLLSATKAFSGVKGTLYNADTVFHFGSGSFAHSTDPRLLRQVAGRINSFFVRKIDRDVYRLSFLEKFMFAVAFGLIRFRDILKS